LDVVFNALGGRVDDAHIVKLIDIYWYLTAGFANRLTEDAADEAGVIQIAKAPAPGAPIAKQLLTRAPNPVPA
jgi:hypothetical protein